jgi:hypothetical protein
MWLTASDQVKECSHVSAAKYLAGEWRYQAAIKAIESEVDQRFLVTILQSFHHVPHPTDTFNLPCGPFVDKHFQSVAHTQTTLYNALSLVVNTPCLCCM